MIITIDGPAGSGKTTVAKRLAEKLGFLYFDTGAIYRAFTYLVLKEQIDIHQKTALRSLLTRFHYEIKKEKEGNRYFVNQEDVTEKIRSPEVTRNVSEVSALKEVRDVVVNLTREWGKIGNAVFEGRDMGTVVFPNAKLKIFLSARAEVRAKRRYRELQEKNVSSEEVYQEITNRDHLDSTRELSPLKKAPDAHEIDTSDLSLDQVIEKIAELYRS